MLNLISVGADLAPESRVPAMIVAHRARLLNLPIVAFADRLLECCIVSSIFSIVSKSGRLVVRLDIGC